MLPLPLPLLPEPPLSSGRRGAGTRDLLLTLELFGGGCDDAEFMLGTLGGGEDSSIVTFEKRGVTADEHVKLEVDGIIIMLAAGGDP